MLDQHLSERVLGWIRISRMRILPLTIILTLFSLSLEAKIGTTTTRVSGFGLDRQSAITNALMEAVSQVKGVKLESMETMKTEFSESSLSSNGKDESSSFSSDESISEVSKITKGIVQSYDVIEIYQVDRGYESVLDVSIAVYKASAQANRLRMAVVPFRILSSVTEPDFERLFTNSLNSYLTQSRRFAMIDRKYSHEQRKELRLIQGDIFKAEEAARVGNQLGTDYLILGAVDSANKKTSTIHMRTMDKSINRTKTQVDLSFRILDVATGQVKYANEYSKSLDGNISLNSIAKEVADSVGNDIINAIYPILVAKIDGNKITLGQGGKTLKIGDKLKLIKYGEKIHDQYTGESLGYTEIEIGIVKIISVQSKLSTAEIIKLTVDDIDHEDRMIVRFIDSAKKNNAKEGIKEEEAKLKKKSANFNKDDDW